MASISRLVGRTSLIARKVAPDVLTAAGVVGVVGTVILASRATLKSAPRFEQFKEDREEVKALAEDGMDYSEAQRRKDVVYLYRRFGVDMIKAYAPSVTLGAVSIGALLTSHGMMKSRNLAAVAAFKAAESAYAEYRRRVIEEFGEEGDEKVRFGDHKIVRVTEDDDKDTDHIPMAFVDKFDPNNVSLYARFFDQTNPNWDKFPDYNLVFLKGKQNYLNDKLKVRGHVFLNEVYEELGLDHSGIGSMVGWVYGAGQDNYIDFGLYNAKNAKAREFVNGQESAILLDFNVDGEITSMIDSLGRTRRR